MALEDIEKLKEKVKKDPNSKLFVPLAEEYRKKGMLDEAISVLMTGITSQPGYTSARVSLGKIYLEKKMAPAAKEEFEKVVSAIPDNLFAHKKLAEIYRDSGEKERAIGEYRVVLKLNPLDDDAVSNLETLQRGHMQEESITAAESAPEEFTVQGNEAVEPSTQTAGKETIKAEGVEVLPVEEPLQPPHGDEFEAFKRSMAGQGEAASPPEADTKAGAGTQPEDVFGEEVISDEDMEEAEKEVMSYAATFGEQDTAQPFSSFEALKEEKAPVAERLPEKEDKGSYSPKDAELFISEGNYLKAMSIYREILSANPQDKYVMQKVEELRLLLKMLGKDKEAVIDKLETFGARIREKKMSFSEVLKETVGKVDGAVSAIIISSDGMPVEEYASEKLINLEDLSAEASAMIKDIGNAAETLGLGEAREFSIISDKCGIIMRKINKDYYLALIIKPEGNYGKGRFVLKTTITKIEKEF